MAYPRYSDVFEGHLVEVRLRRNKEDGNHIECLVFPDETNKGKPLAEWVMPYQLRYYLPDVAKAAYAQTAIEGSCG